MPSDSLCPSLIYTEPTLIKDIWLIVLILLFYSSSYALLPVIANNKGKGPLYRPAFSSAAPQIWNHIPTTIKVSPSLDSFKYHLKTHYFTSP